MAVSQRARVAAAPAAATHRTSAGSLARWTSATASALCSVAAVSTFSFELNLVEQLNVALGEVANRPCHSRTICSLRYATIA